MARPTPTGGAGKRFGYEDVRRGFIGTVSELVGVFGVMNHCPVFPDRVAGLDVQPVWAVVATFVKAAPRG